MAIDTINLLELSSMVHKGPAMVTAELGAFFLVGPPQHDDARWTYRTRQVATPSLGTVSLGQLTPDMVCWPLKRTGLGALGAVRVGRAPSNDVVLQHSDVSKLHARLWVKRNAVVEVEDAGSANGTFINGKRAAAGTHALLVDGDRLGLGALELWFQSVAGLQRLTRQ